MIEQARPTSWYPGIAIQRPDGTTIHSCPVDDCEWSWMEVPVELQRTTLADIFGPGTMLNLAVNQRAQRIEDALAEHFSSHPIADFVRTIMRLRAAMAAVDMSDSGPLTGQ